MCQIWIRSINFPSLCPVIAEVSRCVFQLVSHIEEMLQTAYNKLHKWQSRRLMKKTWSVCDSHRFCESKRTVTCSDSGNLAWDMPMITQQWQTSAPCQLSELMLLYLHIVNWKERNCDWTRSWGGKLRQNQNELSCKYIYIHIYIF